MFSSVWIVVPTSTCAHDGLDVVQGDTLDRKGSHTATILTTLHQGNDGPLLAFGMASTAQTSTLFFRAWPDLIDFRNAAQFLNHAVLSHGEAGAVTHEPNRFVADSSHAMNLMS
jgi:hypothetical protein